MLRRPAVLFAAVSLLVGILTIAVTPPLRGPDENAHFLRAYGISQGDFVPRLADDRGRRGLMLPAQLFADFEFFDIARQAAGTKGFSYRQVFAGYMEPGLQESLLGGGEGSVFAAYGGSEAYTPIPYLPYAAAAALAELAGFEFLPTLYLMRFAGLLATTAIIAYAIARTPVLPWGLFAVAMLPSAVYGRSVLSADGAAFATTLLVLALCLRGAAREPASPWHRALWMTLCALTKPSQVVFAALELMTRPLRLSPRHWLAVAAVVLPGLVLATLWVAMIGGEMAAWRLDEGGSIPAEQFRPGWKLQYMLTHPLHFPAALITSLDYSGELWRQLIGVLGWLDTRLHPLAYPELTLLLLIASIDRLELPVPGRWRVALVAAVTALVYCLGVFALFYITSTPVTSDRVLGLQGRYFLAVLPLAALAVAALRPRRPGITTSAVAAILLTAISGAAILEAVLRTDWP